MLFADDTNFSCDGLTSREKPNTDLVSIDKWLSANKLTLKNSKTEFMIIGSRYRLDNLEDNLEINLGETIKRVITKKSLGVILDSQLNWKMHTEAQSKNNSKSIVLLRRPTIR